MNKAASLASTATCTVAGIIMMVAKSIDDLAAEQVTLAEESQAILDLCDEEDRDATEDELATVMANKDAIAALSQRMELVQAATLPDRPAGPGRRTSHDVDDRNRGRDDRPLRPVPAAARQSRTFGFNHLGDFALTVRGAAFGDETALTRFANISNQMSEGVGEDGGFLVPPEMREAIMKVVEGEDSLLSRTDGSVSSKNAVVHPKDETTPWGTAGIRAYWEGEADAATASKAKFQGDSLRLNKLFARVDVTDELLEDAPQLDNYLRVKTPEVMTSVINLAIIQGNGVGKPLGFMNSPALVTVAKETSQPADTVHHRNIVNMWSRMYAPSRRTSVWIINQDVEPQLLLLSFRDGDTTPVPIYMPAGGLSASPYGMLLGRPVLPLQGMETLGDLGDIAFVDLTKYRTLTKSGGLRVDTSIHLKFDTDETVYRFIIRLAGHPWWSAPITPRDGSNTLSPFITLASR